MLAAAPELMPLPFAKEVKSVTALDGAIEMCRILEQKVEELGLDNIQVIHRLWEELDIEKEGLAEKFDLVFASMTPAVSDFETLDKLNQASSKYCWPDHPGGGAILAMSEKKCGNFFLMKRTPVPGTKVISFSPSTSFFVQATTPPSGI